MEAIGPVQTVKLEEKIGPDARGPLWETEVIMRGLLFFFFFCIPTSLVRPEKPGFLSLSGPPSLKNWFHQQSIALQIGVGLHQPLLSQCWDFVGLVLGHIVLTFVNACVQLRGPSWQILLRYRHPLPLAPRIFPSPLPIWSPSLKRQLCNTLNNFLDLTLTRLQETLVSGSRCIVDMSAHVFLLQASLFLTSSAPESFPWSLSSRRWVKGACGVRLSVLTRLHEGRACVFSIVMFSESHTEPEAALYASELCVSTDWGFLIRGPEADTVRFML